MKVQLLEGGGVFQSMKTSITFTKLNFPNDAHEYCLYTPYLPTAFPLVSQQSVSQPDNLLKNTHKTRATQDQQLGDCSDVLTAALLNETYILSMAVGYIYRSTPRGGTNDRH